MMKVCIQFKLYIKTQFSHIFQGMEYIYGIQGKAFYSYFCSFISPSLNTQAKTMWKINILAILFYNS